MKKKFRVFIALIAVFAIIASFCAGCANKSALASPSGFRVSDDYVLSWTDVPSARGYEVRVNNLDGTKVAVETPKRSSVSLSFLEEGDYIISVRAVSDGTKYTNSEWSAGVDFRKNYETGCIYKLINNNSEYEISSGAAVTGEVTIEDYYRDKPVTSIGPASFKNSMVLTRIVIGNKVQKIGDNAFFRCPNLEEIVIPQSVKEIGSAAFQSCDKIASVTLPDSLENIASFTFAYCKSLTSIDLSHVKTIGESAFSNCTGLENVVIPDGVTDISKDAFFRCTSVESIAIGNGLEYIPATAFASCENLKTVNFGDKGNLKTLGTQCFGACISLENIVLPDGLETVGDYVFYDCRKLNDVTIPECVTDVGKSAFNNTKIFNDAKADGDRFTYVGNWVVAASSDSLSNMSKLSADDFNSGVVGIAGSVFKDMKNEESGRAWTFEVPASLKYICSYAFSNTELWRITSGMGAQLERIGFSAFRDCANLSNVVLRDGLKEIDGYAFYGCKLLGNSTQFSIIPSTVERVGMYAFRDTEIFNNPDVHGVVYAGIVGEENWVVDCVNTKDNPVRSVDLKTTVYGIADWAFGGCEYLRSITGLNRASILGSFAFADCKSLLAVALNPNLDSIKEGTFYLCASLTDVSLPVRVKTIGDRAFGGCSSLITVKNIESNALTSIGYAAFAFCANLSFEGDGSRLHFGANLKELGEYAFYGCEELDNVKIPDGLKVISAHAFSHCYNLANFDFGNGVEEIGDYAFYSEDLLGEDGWTISKGARGVKINLPASVKKIGRYAFYGCGRGYSFDDEVEDIWGSGSGINRQLTDAKLGNVEEIGEFAFANAYLGNLELPDSLKTIGKYAFHKSVLNSLTIGNGVENIDRHAFNGCSNITFYCEDGNRPESWDARWNSSYRPVIWGCVLSEEGYVESVTISSSTLSHGLNGVAAPVRAGYEFVGWSQTSGSETADYTAEEFINIPVGTTVYAVWRSVAN